ISGDTIVVGALLDDIITNIDQGSAYVFTRVNTLWTQQKLIANGGSAGDLFGQSVALSGDTVVVGALFDTVGANTAQGSASVFACPACPTVTINPANLSGPQLGVLYSENLMASGGTGPYQFSLSEGVLPPGLTLEQDGHLSGTPTTAGTYRFTITATILSSLCPGSRSYTLNVQQGCSTFIINPTLQNFAAAGGTGSINVTGDSGCPWTAVSNVNWILIGNSSGTGNGSVGFAVGANNGGAARSGQILVAGQTFTVNQAAFNCTFSLSPASFNVTALGGPGSVDVTTQNGCAWTAVSNAAWITITAGANGTGNGTFSFSIAVNPSASPRIGTVMAGGQTFTVNQDGATQTANGLQFYPLPRPVRILDTRPGQGNCDNISAPINGGTSLTTFARLTCEGISIPANAQAIVGNLTIINQTAQIGYLTIYPDGQAAPLAANMIYEPGGILANNFTVGLSANGNFNIFGERTIDAIVDISGYYAPPAPGGLYYHPLSKPVRLLDTRAGQGNCDNVNAPINAETSLTKQAHINCEGLTIPAAAQAIVGNATVINVSGQTGYLTIYPNGVPAPLAGNIVYFPGQILANAFTVSLGATGEFNIFAERQIDMVIDVAGYYSNEAVDANGVGLLFNPLSTPVRLLDTRAGQGNCDSVNAPINSGTSLTKMARMTCEGQIIPNNAQAVIGNVTVINQTALPGYLTLYPTGQAAPLAANMIYQPGQILSNAFVVGLSASGQFNIFAERTLDAIVDVSGFFAP
ncbi:MAG: putative Ig domain-containing protein, partial [Acidobacteriota bacterium]